MCRGERTSSGRRVVFFFLRGNRTGVWREGRAGGRGVPGVWEGGGRVAAAGPSPHGARATGGQVVGGEACHTVDIRQEVIFEEKKNKGGYSCKYMAKMRQYK